MKEKIFEMIAKVAGVDKSSVNEGTVLRDLFDSLDMAELIMDVEKEFSCEISDGVAEKIKTVKDLINAIKK